MQGISEYKFLTTADTLIGEIRVCLYSNRGE